MIDRFFRYVKIDTQSQEDVEDRYPSTEKQKELLKMLVGGCGRSLSQYRKTKRTSQNVS
jgi:di/tripeptidase